MENLPKLNFQKHMDSEGRLGPTLRKLADRAAFKKDKANFLENVFDLVAPLGLYSKEAHGGLFKATGMSPADLTKVRTARSRGATDRDILRDFGLVYDGRNYLKYTPDDIDESLLASLFGRKTPFGTYAKPTGSGTEMTLKDIITNSRTPDTKVLIENKPFTGQGDYTGYYQPNKNNPIVGLNLREGRTMPEMREVVGHEGNHALDHQINYLGAGSNPADVPKYITDDLSRKKGRVVSPEEAYLMNRGEERSFTNGFLARYGVDEYRGPQSVFDSHGFNFRHDPNNRWGD